jgi:hypothetical protein
MPIIDVSPVGSSRLGDRPIKIVPVYLVTVDDPTVKTQFNKYLAVKLDEQANSVKLVGFEIKETDKNVCQNYQEILSSTDKGLYKEIVLPWQRIVRIQNLIFKQK